VAAFEGRESTTDEVARLMVAPLYTPFGLGLFFDASILSRISLEKRPTFFKSTSSKFKARSFWWRSLASSNRNTKSMALGSSISLPILSICSVMGCGVVV
jgi:hypothetical protein